MPVILKRATICLIGTHHRAVSLETVTVECLLALCSRERYLPRDVKDRPRRRKHSSPHLALLEHNKEMSGAVLLHKSRWRSGSTYSQSDPAFYRGRVWTAGGNYSCLCQWIYRRLHPDVYSSTSRSSSSSCRRSTRFVQSCMFAVHRWRGSHGLYTIW